MSMVENQSGGSAPAGNPPGDSKGAAAAPPPAEGNANGQQGAAPVPGDWTTGLTEDNRKVAVAKGWDKSVSPVDGLNTAIKSYSEIEARLGKSIVIPDANAPKEDHDKLFAALGKPKTPGDYSFKLPEGVPDNFPYDDAFATEFKNAAHAASLVPSQAAGIHDWFVKRSAEQMATASTTQTAAVSKAHQAITAKFGEESTVGYKRAVELMGRAIRKLNLRAPYQAAGIVTPAGEIANADVAFSLHEIGKAMFAEDNADGNPGQLTTANPWKEGQENLTEQGRIAKEHPEQARALVIAAGKDPDKALYKPS